MASVASDFKVCTWNTLVDSWKDNAKPCLKGMSFETRADLIIGRVKRMECDVLCFQEVDQFDKLAEKMDKVGYWGVFAKRNNGQNEGCALFYNNKKIQILNDKTLTHYFNDGTGRLIQQVTVKILSDNNSKPITFLNTHIENAHHYKNREEGFAKRTEEVEMLVQKSVEAAKEGNPVIVCGDFNIDAKFPVFLNGFTMHGFIDSLKDTPNAHKPTIAFSGAFKEQETKDELKRIDYVFSKNIQRLTSEVRGDPANLNKPAEPSDHLPILAAYVIPH